MQQLNLELRNSMKILMINSFCGLGSTGRICTDLADVLSEQGHEVKIAYGRDTVPEKYQKYAVRIGTDIDVKLHGVQTRLFDTHGFGSKGVTKRFLEWADSFAPDVLHLHNIHGYYINIKLLFEWIKKHPQMRVIWTLHDCWPFTGHCVHFTVVECTQWKTHCEYCTQKRTYPKSDLFSNCKNNYDRKKTAFTSVKDMTIVTPSKWLAELVKESFLREYPVQVINNGIDTSVFKPTPSDFRLQYQLEGKKIILGVASVWDERKGLNDFIKLSELLDDSYKIVLVGLSEKQMKSLPANILGIKRTKSVKELAEIYSAADVFFNPSYEETMGLVTIEAIACGTPVLVSDCTAVPEFVNDKVGQIFHSRNGNTIYSLIKRIIDSNYEEDNLMSYASTFEKNIKYMEYRRIYDTINT